MLTISVAGITVGIVNKYKHIERISRSYLTDREPEFTVEATEAEMAKERAQCELELHDGYIESTVIHRKIANKLWRYDAFLFHGATLELDGRAYAFTAPSGTGKTTHTRLWLERFGARVRYVNGDKPIVRFIDGVPYAFGTPWLGKEGYGENTSSPLAGIACLKRGEANEARRLSFDEASNILLSQIYIPREPTAALRTLALVNRLSEGVLLIELKCNMDIEAAEVAARALGAEL